MITQNLERRSEIPLSMRGLRRGVFLAALAAPLLSLILPSTGNAAERTHADVCVDDKRPLLLAVGGECPPGAKLERHYLGSDTAKALYLEADLGVSHSSATVASIESFVESPLTP